MSRVKWLEVSTVSKRLNVSAMTVYRLVKKQSLRGAKFGVSGCMRVSEKSVVEFEQRRASSMEEPWL